MLEENTIIPDNIITINNYKEGCEKSVTWKVCNFQSAYWWNKNHKK